jgi:hypothetical protein
VETDHDIDGYFMAFVHVMDHRYKYEGVEFVKTDADFQSRDEKNLYKWGIPCCQGKREHIFEFWPVTGKLKMCNVFFRHHHDISERKSNNMPHIEYMGLYLLYLYGATATN